MPQITKKTQRIRSFLLKNIPDHPKDAATLACDKFGISRQSINRHLHALMKQGLVTASGNTRQRSYQLATLFSEIFEVAIADLKEDVLWQKRAAPLLKDLPQNVLHIWHYGFTEMVNNVIDHSGGTRIRIRIRKTAVFVSIIILDDGVGIFHKIQSELGLEDERHAVLELSKGKLTTDPDNHTGEGIFFSSRMFDEYTIRSGKTQFSHRGNEDEDWIFETAQPEQGTAVYMLISNDSRRTTKKILDQYSSNDGDYRFIRTVVPVRLLRYGLEQLVSRSQAKRLLARVDRFKIVLLDFKDVDRIGQAFADEIFRVFANQHPAIQIVPVNMSASVKNMVNRAKAEAMNN